MQTIEARGWLLVDEDGHFEFYGDRRETDSQTDAVDANNFLSDTVQEARRAALAKFGVVTEIYEVRIRVPRPSRTVISFELGPRSIDQVILNADARPAEPEPPASEPAVPEPEVPEPAAAASESKPPKSESEPPKPESKPSKSESEPVKQESHPAGNGASGSQARSMDRIGWLRETGGGARNDGPAWAVELRDWLQGRDGTTSTLSTAAIRQGVGTNELQSLCDPHPWFELVEKGRGRIVRLTAAGKSAANA